MTPDPRAIKISSFNTLQFVVLVKIHIRTDTVMLLKTVAASKRMQYISPNPQMLVTVFSVGL